MFCPRSHSSWQTLDLSSEQSPLVSRLLPLLIPGDEHVWDAHCHRGDVVPVAKANMRGEKCGTLFSNCFLPHSAQFPSLFQIPHPTGHFRLRWRIRNTRKQLALLCSQIAFSGMISSNFLKEDNYKKGLISQCFIYTEQFRGAHILRDTCIVFYPLTKGRKSCLPAAEFQTTPSEYSR